MSLRSATRLVLTAAAVGLSGCSAAGASKVPAGVPSLDPSLYRAQIVAIDRIVYDTAAITEVARDTLADQFELLAQRVTSDDASKAARVLSQNLQHLAKEVRARSLTSVRAGDTLQVDWELARGRAFRDAAWWRHNVDDPVASVEADRPHPSSRLSPALDLEATQVEVAVRELEDLADDGDRELGGSTGADSNARSGKNAWPEVRNWQGRIEHEALQVRSTPPTPGNPQLDSAYHQTVEAVKSLRNAASMSYAPGSLQWIGDAHTHLREARRHLQAVSG